MPTSDFYRAEPLAQVAINLFYGWGYNFYRKQDQLRADDLLVRSQACHVLGQARAAVEAAETAYRRAFLPAPTRQKPFADAAAIAGAQSLERLSKAIGALEGQIRGMPAPANDRMSERYRDEAGTLRSLLDCDQMLIGQADLLRSRLDHKDGTAILADLAEAEGGLSAIGETLRRRQAVLLAITGG